ncbi:MAG: amidohydrolase family protein [Pirellulaceae bacterium]
MRPKLYRAAWILPVREPRIRDGLIAIRDGRVEELRSFGESDKFSPLETELPAERTVILPGFVNAHTHLEFSNLSVPLGQFGMPFVDWLRTVIRHRAHAAGSALNDKNAAIRTGMKESHSLGVAALGEIASAPWSLREYELGVAFETEQGETTYARNGIDVIAFLEQLGAIDSLADERFEAVSQAISQSTSIPIGISPHSPYSASRPLFDYLISGTSRSVPVAMHLAESMQEIEFCDSGTGDFRSFLLELGFDISNQERLSIEHCLQGLATHLRALVVHGNYLNESQLDFVAANPQMHLVYCPRTHAYFDHERYPVASILKRGIKLAVGTDSRASSPDLDLLAELRLIHQCFPDIPAEEILKMGTTNGASALGLNDSHGFLASNSNSRALAIIFRDAIDGSPEERLLNGDIDRRIWIN